MTIYDRIFALANKLAKALSNGEETDALKEADYLSQETKTRIQESLSKPALEEQLGKLKEIDVENDWAKVVERLQKPTRSLMPKLYKAAAIALLLFSLSYLTYNHIQKSEQGVSVQVAIEPGTDKALLILEDGTQVALSPETTFKNKVAQSKEDRLEYNYVNAPLYTAVNYLVVPRGGQYQLKLADGTEIWLNADTKIKYPIAFQPGETRTVELLYGEAYLMVSPSSKHQGDAFKIIAKGQEVNVIGTIFNLKAYNDEEKIYTTLVEGKVHIAAKDKSVELHPGEQSVWDHSTNQLSKSSVDVNHHTAWIRGYFYFEDKPLKEIMQVLSRWYDVHISFDSPELQNVKFSGLLSKEQTIEEILNGIKNTNSISAYEIKNKSITIK
ncbi:Fe2+-dicitrate sensor, membrane component [Aequorivita sublithincola DSM 14238]|uniref:Fe2+-dicitrate sensor, membrane component n=1 Tax=Aequorivita sublithincola (strain DSM 14238 / LMG 21431 / ACAM 643 / 9-3) TaxID=746697 RepID=I3YZV7_AEQSU|nr:FecR family protein [Aequorivita sublithincola]AFL82525.1 Fe2+-dicitrate sensor, membrane component [Aequorivita sublithincola DSM 14238]